jgi:glycogen debranching enzyme
MANLGEVPFSRYYGSVDATPLFVMLAGAYLRRTGDLGLIRSIWPNIQLALRWIDEYGDRDGDCFVEYARMSPTGLIQQGWKDSHDSIFCEDGRLAEAPIALCEVQGYAYAARVAAASIASELGHASLAEAHLRSAIALRQRFEEAFWDAELGTYVLALDGSKRPCRVRSSNAGHCLFSGIASAEHAQPVIEQLLSDSFFTGWGIRTIAEGAARYNPMGYHNGSVWPHDNALAAAGMAQYGANQGAARILTALFEASTFFDLMRLPELFCGFLRRQGKAPTAFPVACSPQAWSAAAPYLLMESCLGLSIDALHARITLSRPVLPFILDRVYVSGLVVGEKSIDLELFQHGGVVTVAVPKREGRIEVVVVQ